MFRTKPVFAGSVDYIINQLNKIEKFDSRTDTRIQSIKGIHQIHYAFAIDLKDIPKIKESHTKVLTRKGSFNSF